MLIALSVCTEPGRPEEVPRDLSHVLSSEIVSCSSRVSCFAGEFDKFSLCNIRLFGRNDFCTFKQLFDINNPCSFISCDGLGSNIITSISMITH